MEDIKKYFEAPSDMPPVTSAKSSVHGGNEYRLSKAKEQAALEPVEVEVIMAHVNAFLAKMGIPEVQFPVYRFVDAGPVDYQELEEKYGLADPRDIVWLKFTKDGYLGCVAVSNDVNFDYPPTAADYDKQELRYDSYAKRKRLFWVHTSAGILLHQLGKEWDTSFVLIFPLSRIPAGYRRGDIEQAIGNYLIAQGVPILDFYSHNF